MTERSEGIPGARAPASRTAMGSGGAAPEQKRRKADIGADAFFALDLRVGRILAVEPFPEARKPAWKLRADFGPEVGELQTSAQVTNYTEAELVGRLVVGAINLGSKRIAGYRSEFLVLGGIDAAGTVHLLSVEGVEPGDQVA